MPLLSTPHLRCDLAHRVLLGIPSRPKVMVQACCAALAALLSGFGVQALGQTPALNSEFAPVVALTPVEVRAHYSNGIGTSDAASEGLVTGKRLTDLPLLRPGEVLETIPGMVVTQHSGDGKANQYFLRGYNLDHGTDFASFVDGLPLNMPTHAHGHGYTDLNFLIPELVDSIAYRKGPYFAQNGDFSSAGSAHIQYREKLERGIADLTLGSFGYRRQLVADSTTLNADKNAPGGGLRLLGALETLQDNGPWTSPEGLRKTNALLKLSDGNRANGWSMNAGFYRVHWNATDQIPLSMIESGQLGLYSTLDSTDGGRAGHERWSGEWHQNDSGGYARASAYAQHAQMQLWSNFTFYEWRPATGDQFEQHETRQLLGGQFTKGWHHSLGRFDATTELGFQVRHDNISVGSLNTQARTPFATVRDDRVRETQLGVYAQNTVNWSPWFRTLTGLRADRVQMAVDSYATPQNSGTAAAARISPKLSLVFGPWKKTEFFINYGNGFHSNDARGVIEKIDPTTGSAATPVPAMVGSRGMELGLRTAWIEGLQSSVALWRLNSNSELIYSADSTLGSTAPNGASKRYGLEWNNHMRINKWLLLDADMAWTHARYATPNDNGALGDFIPNAVSKVALLGATVQGAGPWSGGVVLRYVGAYPLSQDGSLIGPSAIVTNLRVQKEINRSVTLKLDVLNALNRKGVDIAYAQDYQVSPSTAAVPNGVTVHPGEPRQLRVTLHFNF